MHIISLVSQKGGAGKSLLALNLAVAAEAAGETVALIDFDPQGTVAHWYATRTSERPAVVMREDCADLRAGLGALPAAGVTLAIIDTKGDDAPGTRDAMRLADLCLIPIRPSGPDLHASRATIEALRIMGKTVALVVNQAITNPKAAKVAQLVIAGMAQHGTVVPIAVAARMDHQYAYALGEGTVEYAPHGKAADEIRRLWGWCAKTLKGTKDGKAERRRRRDGGVHEPAGGGAGAGGGAAAETA